MYVHVSWFLEVAEGLFPPILKWQLWSFKKNYAPHRVVIKFYWSPHLRLLIFILTLKSQWACRRGIIQQVLPVMVSQLQLILALSILYKNKVLVT